jgi:hypothetical protein
MNDQETSSSYRELNSKFKTGKILVHFGVGVFCIGIMLKFIFPSVMIFFVLIPILIGIILICFGVYKMRFASKLLQRHVSERARFAISVISSNAHTMRSEESVNTSPKPPDYESPPDYQEVILESINKK